MTINSINSSNTVSIIIPVYNSARYIKDTIMSCLDQRYTNIEVIVVNDGSTDNSEEIILSIKDDRIKYFKIPNGGACVARNFGISNAKGNLFQFLDADDILDKDKLYYQVEKYLVHGDKYVYSAEMGMLIGETKELSMGYELFKHDFVPTNYFEILLDQHDKFLTTGIWLIPSAIVNAIGGWDINIKLNQDGEYFMRAILNSSGILFCKDSIFYYRRDVVNSISKKRDNKAIYDSWLHSYESYAENFKKKLDIKTANYLGWKALSVYYCNSYPKYPDLLERCFSQIKALGYSQPDAHGGERLKKVARWIGTLNALKLLDFKKKLVKR